MSTSRELTPFLKRRGFDPARIEAAAHGTNVKYVWGRCRCELCTTASRNLNRSRARAIAEGTWIGLVDAAPVRAHLIVLSKAGIGCRTVHNFTGIPYSSLQDVKYGNRKKIRADKAEKVLRLDVTCQSDRGHVPAAPALAIIRRLQKDMGLTKTAIARRLGLKQRALQYARSKGKGGRRFVREETYQKLKALETRILNERASAAAETDLKRNRILDDLRGLLRLKDSPHARIA